MAMPDRIWAGTVIVSANDAAHQLGVWGTEPAGRLWDPAEFIRADLVDELVKAAEEVSRLSLVIESAVRNADPGNRPDVLAALQQTKAALTRIDALKEK